MRRVVVMLIALAITMGSIAWALDRQRAELNRQLGSLVEFEVGFPRGSLDFDGVTPLIKRGASIQTRSENGSTVLMYAAWIGDLRLATQALTGGVPVNAQPAGGLTALHCAAQQGSSEMTDLLLRHGANLELQTISGHTPLSYAIVNGKPKVVAALLSAGADRSCKDCSVTPRDLAESPEYRVIQRLLKSHGQESELDKRPSARN